MKVAKPADMNSTFANAFNSGNIENLLALFESDAQIIERDGKIATGLEGLRTHFLKLLSIGGQMSSENQYAVEMDNVALLRAKWKISTSTPEGKPLEIAGHSAEIVRRQADGTWLYIVDHPFGSGDLTRNS